MISRKQVDDYLLSMPNSKRDYPFGEDVAVYKVFAPSKLANSPAQADGAQGAGEQQAAMSRGEGQEKMFALVPEKTKIVSISLKCDPQLAEVLRDKYETVMPGYHLNKKHWNTIVLSGQLDWEEIQGFINHSYNLVTGKQ